MRLSLCLLGSFQALLDSEPITSFESAKVRALLAYLATEAERMHPRALLTGLLWPDWPEAAASRNLSRALSNLRSAIGDRDAIPPYLLISRETVQFNLSSDCWVDVHAFRELARAKGEHRLAVDQLAHATALYRGSFLEGFSLDDSPAFDDWLLLTRERLARGLAAALQRLVREHERHGECEQACRYAWQSVELEPWREEAHQQLMRALAQSGQRSAALAQFEACRRALREELGVEPGAETVRLYEQIRDGKLTVPRPPSPTGTLTGSLPSPPVDSAEATEARAPVPPPPARTPAEAERRVVTVLSARIKRVLPTGQPIDVELWADIVRRALGMLERKVHRYGGVVSRFREDGLVAYFGATDAHEDDPERAVLAALGMREAVRSKVAGVAAPKGICVQLRVGVNTGEVILTRVGERGEHGGDVALGRAVSVAQGLEAAATDGVLVGEGTYRLVRPLFDWHAVGEFTVADEPDALAAYRPLARKAQPGKGRGIPGLSSPLIGRDAQLRALQCAIESLRAGVGGIVTVVGEAGIGKSRLVAEVRNGVGAVREPPLQWIEGRCLSYSTSVAYQVWEDVLRELLGVAPDAPPAAVVEALRERVGRLCPDCADEVYPFLVQTMFLPLPPDAEARLRGVESEGLRVLTFRAVGTVLERAAREVPLAMVYEDLHWADPTSLALLEHLLPLTDRVPLLLICVFRPVRRDGCWRIKELATRDYRHRHTDLWLDALTEREGAELLGHLLDSGDLPEALRGRILERAEGNPFYLEEILRALIDGGIIVRDDASGQWGATQQAADIPIPDTLRGVLTARIDRLPETARHVLQAASVVGRIFDPRVLEVVSQRERGLDEDLAILQRAQMVRQRTRLPEGEYIFKHQLTLEAAYERLLTSKRRDLHRWAAQALEQLYPERVEEQLGLLAYHWERAAQVGPAVAYLRRAGEQAAAQFANAEAIDYYSRALDLTPEEDLEGRYALLLARERTFDLQGARDAQRQDLTALEAVAGTLADPGQQVDVALRQAHYATRTQDYHTAAAAARAALRWAEVAGDLARRAAAHRELGRALRYTWEEEQRAAAQAELERAVNLARAVGSRQTEIDALHDLGDVRAVRGDLDAQKHCFEEQLRICREMGNRKDEGRALRDLGVHYLFLDRYVAANAYFEQSLRACQETGNRRDEGWALLFVGMGCIFLGDYATALAHSEGALRLYCQTGDRQGELLACESLIRVALYTGDLATAWKWLAEAQQFGAHAYLWAVLGGDIACAGGDNAAAQAYYEKALASSITEDVIRYYEARCGLAGLALAEGNVAQAQRWVDEILPILGESWWGSPFLGLQPHLTCYRVLRAAGDPCAQEILEKGYRLLQERASQIGDRDLRRSYLENVPAHCEIVAAYAQRGTVRG